MLCPSCNHDNQPDRRFCVECGAALALKCSACGSPYAAGKKFCGECGAPLRGPAVDGQGPVEESLARPRPAVPGPHSPGERRQLTLLFSDLAGSTELSTRLDAEDYRDVVAAYQRAAATAVNRFGGHIVKYLGDGVLVLFGYPRAHENDAERAVQAGLAILEGVREIETGESDGSRLAARVGVHTGEAVIAGDDAVDVFGEAPNIAARVQSTADVDSLYLTAETLRLLGNAFAVEARGSHTLKGIREPLMLYRVTRAITHARSRPGGGRGRAALVDREREWEQLLQCWGRARGGRGCTVLISGEPGIGKTRLVHALRDHLAGEKHSWLAGETSPYHQQTDLYPIRTLLASQALPSSVVAALRDAAVANPDRHREHLLSLVSEWIADQARSRPTVLAIEDLHWADASTIEFVGRLAAEAANRPLLIVLTARPELERPLRAEVELLTLILGPLSADDTRAAIRARAPSGALSEQSIESIVARSDGVPLFVEELVDFFLEAGEASVDKPRLGHAAIPATLQSLLMTRIDRLGGAKTAAQIGAVLGREFNADVLRSVSKLPADALDVSLRELARAGVLVPMGSPAERRYAFRHALIRDAAYALLLRRTRKTLHRDTASALVQDFPQEAEQQPEIVAHHYELGGDDAAAARYWRRAARAGMARGAYVEVIERLRRGLAALANSGEAASEDALVMHLLLGQALQATRGQEDQAAIREYDRARALGAELADSPHLTRVLTATYEVAVAQGAMHTAREVVAQMRELGLQRNDPTLLTCAHAASGVTSFAAGDLHAAREAFDEVARHHHPELRQRDFMTGFTARSYRPLLSWLLGRPDKARRECDEERQRAVETDHPFAQAIVINGIGLAHAFRGDTAATRETAETLLAIAGANGYGLFEKSAVCLRAIARLLEGERAAAIRDLESGIDRILETARSWATAFLPFLAQGLCDIGAPQRALNIVERNLAEDAERGHALCRAEFERVRALALELLGSSGDEVVAAAYAAALATARRQGARAFELRGALGLSRFRVGRGDARGAAQVLAAVLDEWTEGWDTPDVVAAETLLRELSRRSVAVESGSDRSG